MKSDGYYFNTLHAKNAEKLAYSQAKVLEKSELKALLAGAKAFFLRKVSIPENGKTVSVNQTEAQKLASIYLQDRECVNMEIILKPSQGDSKRMSDHIVIRHWTTKEGILKKHSALSVKEGKAHEYMTLYYDYNERSRGVG